MMYKILTSVMVKEREDADKSDRLGLFWASLRFETPFLPTPGQVIYVPGFGGAQVPDYFYPQGMDQEQADNAEFSWDAKGGEFMWDLGVEDVTPYASLEEDRENKEEEGWHVSAIVWDEEVKARVDAALLAQEPEAVTTEA